MLKNEKGAEMMLEVGILVERVLRNIPKSAKDERILFCENIPEVVDAVSRERPGLMITVWNEEERKTFLQGERQKQNVLYKFIYVGRMLEQTANPEPLIIAVRKMLAYEGHAWHMLGNIHHGEVFKQLNSEHWPGDSEIVGEVFSPLAKHYYTPQDAVDLLIKCGYEDLVVDFVPRDFDRDQSGCEFIQSLNLSDEDLNAVYWFIDTTRCDEVGVYLRQYYNEDVRKELIRYLRRIENGIDVQANIDRLWQLCARENIVFEYLQAFMKHALLYEQRTMDVLRKSINEAQ